MAAVADGARPCEDRAAAVTALALARVPSALRAMWEMVKGKAAEPAALMEAFDDLPEAARDALRQRLDEYTDSRVRDLTRQVFASAVIDDDELLAAIERSPSIEVRQHAAAALVERGPDAVRRILDSPGLVEALPLETIAFAAARIARRDATDLTRRLSEAEITPRLLVALGGTGYLDAIEILLHFVGDRSHERADAAGGALAALSGIDLVEPAGEEDAASEIWSRSAESWRAALASALSGPRTYERIARGGAWSPERVKESLSDRHTRNGVRRTLAGALGNESLGGSVASYYWLQRRTPG
jgi:hypothetical protein